MISDKDITIITYTFTDKRKDSLLYKRCRESVSKFLPNSKYLEFDINDKLSEYKNQSKYLRCLTNDYINISPCFYTDVFRIFDSYKYKNVLYMDKDIEICKDILPAIKDKNFIGTPYFFFSQSPGKELAALKDFYSNTVLDNMLKYPDSFNKDTKLFYDWQVWNALGLKQSMKDLIYHYYGFYYHQFIYITDVKVIKPISFCDWSLMFVVLNPDLDVPIRHVGDSITEVRNPYNIKLLQQDFIVRDPQSNTTFTVTTYDKLCQDLKFNKTILSAFEKVDQLN